MSSQGAVEELLAVSVIASCERLRDMARLRLSAWPGCEAGEREGDFDHLVLEDDRAEGLSQGLLEGGVQVGDLEVGVEQVCLAALDVGVHSAADDRPGPDKRDLDREVRERLGPGAPERPICARDSIWNTPTVSACWITSNTASGRRTGCARDRPAAPLRSAISLDAALDSAESIPKPERSIFRNPASEQESLSHCTICRPCIAGWHDRAAVDQRPCREHHPAGVLGEIAGQAIGLVGESASHSQRPLQVV